MIDCTWQVIPHPTVEESNCARVNFCEVSMMLYFASAVPLSRVVRNIKRDLFEQTDHTIEVIISFHTIKIHAWKIQEEAS